MVLYIREKVEQNITDWYDVNLPARTTQGRPDLARHPAQVTMAATEGLFLAQQIDDAADPEESVTMVVALSRQSSVK